MAAVKSLIQGYADHSVTKWIVEGYIVNFYIQNYRSREITRLNMLTQVGPGMPQKPPVNPVTPDFFFFQNRLFNAFFGYSYRFSQNKTFLFNESS